MQRSYFSFTAMIITSFVLTVSAFYPQASLAADAKLPARIMLPQSTAEGSTEPASEEQVPDSSTSTGSATGSATDSAAAPVSSESEAITATLPISTEVAPTVTLQPALTLVVEMSLVNDVASNDVVDPGDTIRYKITYRNDSDNMATAVQLVGDYDEQFTQIVSPESISAAGQDSGGKIVWDIGDVQAGKEDSQIFDLNLNRSFDPGTVNILLRASIVSVETTAVQEDIFSVTAKPNLSVSVERAPELIVDQGTSGEIDPGDTLRMLIVYRNTGSAGANKLVLTSDYTEGFIGGIAQISENGVDNGSTIVWQIEGVEAGNSGTVSYDFTKKPLLPSLTNQIDTQVTLSSADETRIADASDPFKVSAIPQLSLNVEQKPAILNDLNGNGQADPGDTLRFKILYGNDGSTTGSDIVVEDKYDTNLIESIVNVSDGGQNSGAAVRWDLGAVEVGDNAQLSYDAVLVSHFPTGTTVVENVTSMTSSEYETIRRERAFTINVAPRPSSDAVSNQQPASSIIIGDTFSDSPWVPILFIGFLALSTIGVITYLASNNKDLNLVREPIYLVFIISSILVLTLADDLESDGAISILSAIVGYVFGRATSPSGAR